MDYAFNKDILKLIISFYCLLISRALLWFIDCFEHVSVNPFIFKK